MGKRKGLTTDEIEQIKIYSAAGYSANAVAKEIGRDPKTIRKILEGPEIVKQVEIIRVDLADKWDGLANAMVDSISPEDIKKLNAYQRTIAGGVATDKMRLLREQSTANLDITGRLQQIIEQHRDSQRELEELERKAIAADTGEGDKVIDVTPGKVPEIDSTPCKQ